MDITGLWIDRGGNSVNCITHSDRELTLENVYFENAQNGLVANGLDELRFWGGHGQNVTDIFIKLTDVTDFTIANVECGSQIALGGTTKRRTLVNCVVSDAPANAYKFDGGSWISGRDLVAEQPTGTGFNITSSVEIGRIARGCGNYGVHFNGADRATFFGFGYGNSGQGVMFEGATKCTLFGSFESITFDSNSSDCTVYGSPWATVTNNGTNCSVV